MTLPEVREIEDLDDPNTSELHRRIIRSKPFLRNIYLDNYRVLEKAMAGLGRSVCVELGSGGGFIKDILPNVITSDVLVLQNLNVCFSGEAIPFKEESVDIFFMIDVFHHIKQPRLVLNEMQRCLRPGGKILMIEPANTPWGRFIFQNFHHEQFNPDAGWCIEGDGPMSDANGAQPWIIFSRDRERFMQEYPAFSINSFRCHTPLRYLLSGGVSMRQLLPNFTYPLICLIEIILSPLNPYLGMFCTIELVKSRA
ncbi:MAG: class I SAM-dependent methyltransferase [Candidatus Omnitrophica bacterium]|nr:class I SAM-dependent methyltransferase [Candidatus Omnitrophota bacterium]